VSELAIEIKPARRELVGHALRLEYLTVGWNVVEGIVAIAAALAAGSVALLGFGMDSFVESASGLILVWRLRAENSGSDHETIEALERRALKLVALLLFLLAAFVVVKAALSLGQQERPEVSIVGMAVTATSIGVMLRLHQAAPLRALRTHRMSRSTQCGLAT
jgi:divalent metal cation (Fe/Co/Zn/Cd) transporter